MDTKVAEIASQIVAAFKARVGNAWSNLYSSADQAMIADVAVDAAQLQIDAMAAGSGAALAKIVQEQKHITAQIENLAAIAAGSAASVFWASVGDVLNVAVKLALAAV